MVKLHLNLGERSYPIYVATDYEGLAKCMSSAKLGLKLALITDSNVDKYQSGKIMEVLNTTGREIYKLVIEAGESSKNLDTITNIYKFLMENKFERDSSLLALGGGVVGDITGFTAATYLRGINYVQVPTSLLAQADSSVGGKTGVDFEGNKNIIGAFYQPKLVYINVDSLRTLPKRELQAGLAEVVKHGIIRDPSLFEYVDYNVGKIFDYNADVLQYIAKANCTIKGEIVEQDEKEDELRAILNFGHTIGHAIESVSNYTLLHGECVALGMVGAFKMANYLEMVDEEAVSKVENILAKIGLPMRAGGFNTDEVLERMYHDKKVKNNRLVFILPKAIGEVIQLTIDDRELVRKSLEYLFVQ